TVLLYEAAATANIADGVHQMRVAIRRLRSVVATMREMLPPEQYQWVTQTLKWMAGVLGPARNWDVFSSGLLAPVRSVLLRGQELDESWNDLLSASCAVFALLQMEADRCADNADRQPARVPSLQT